MDPMSPFVSLQVVLGLVTIIGSGISVYVGLKVSNAENKKEVAFLSKQVDRLEVKIDKIEQKLDKWIEKGIR